MSGSSKRPLDSDSPSDRKDSTPKRIRLDVEEKTEEEVLEQSQQETDHAKTQSWKNKRFEDFNEEELRESILLTMPSTSTDALASSSSAQDPLASSSSFQNEEPSLDIPTTSEAALAAPSSGIPYKRSVFDIPEPEQSTSSSSSVASASASSEDSLADQNPTLTPEYIAESMYVQVQHLYMRKKISFDPDYIKSVYSPMIGLPQAKSIIKNVVCDWENRLQMWFDHLLKTKLKEQTDAYSTFSNDNLKRDDDSPPNPSYLG